MGTKLRKLRSKGAILVEFAFAIPILIISLFFVLDIPHLYKLSTKIHKLSELYSRCLLNVVSARENKLLTKADLVNISRAVGVGITGIVGSSKYPFTFSTYVYYVTGTGNNGFTITWAVHVENTLNNSNAPTAETPTGTSYSTVTAASEEAAASLPANWKGFTINAGEKKLIIETVIWATKDGLKKLFYVLPLIGDQFGNQISAITPVDGMLEDKSPVK